METFFEWDAGKYALGVRDMDLEHQQLIRLMNELHRLHESKATSVELGRALTALGNYTARHFADEEAYMAKVGFPGLAVHAGVHRQMMTRIGEFVAEFQKSGKLSDAFFMFLRTWLKAHICGVDTKYAQHTTRAA